MKMLRLLIFLLSVSVCYAQPYLKNLDEPLSECPAHDGQSFNACLLAAIPGRHIVLAGGSYPGLFTLTKAGTEAAPIVIRPAPGAHAIVGNFKMNAAHNYVNGQYGLEIVGGAVGVQGVEMQCGHCGVINSFIHDINGAVGIGAWKTSGPQVIYGNILLKNIPANNNPHNIYAQNDFAIAGYKYFIANVSLDAELASSNSFAFHAYTEGGLISGMWVERNVFAWGRFLIGGFNQPHYNEVVKQNYFYKSRAQMGYRRPIQFQFEDNYLAYAGLKTDYFVGVGETNPLLSGPNTILRNKFYFGRFVDLKTAATGQAQGNPRIRPGDISDDNRIVPTFQGSLQAGGVFQANITKIEDWRNYTTLQGGVNWDINSTVSAPPFLSEMPENEHFFIENEYSPGTATLVVYNWQNVSSLPITRSGNFKVHKIRDPFGPAIATGSDSAIVPLNGEFEMFLIKPMPELCSITKILELANEIMRIRLDPTLTAQRKVRQMGRVDLELIDEAEKCTN